MWNLTAIYTKLMQHIEDQILADRKYQEFYAAFQSRIQRGMDADKAQEEAMSEAGIADIFNPPEK